VRSLARPGGNTTGVSIIFATELDGKRQDILIEAVPGLRRLVALADVNDTKPQHLQALQDATGLAICVSDAVSVAHQPALGNGYPVRVDHRYRVAGGQRDDLLSSAEQEGI
jgi:hypothetical protein